MAKNKKSKKGHALAWLIVIVLLGVGIAIWVYWDYWPWFAAGAIAFSLLWLSVFARRHRVTVKMAAIDRMTGVEFERYLVKLFKGLGYKVNHVGEGGSDFGADLIVVRDKIKVAVQAKNYDSNRVGNDAVQQAIAGASYYHCEMAMVVTNSTFTRAAKQQATGSNLPVALWDRKMLEKAVRGKQKGI